MASAKPAAATVKPTRIVLPNGLVLIVQENHANKTVALDGFLRAGSIYDPEGKYGPGRHDGGDAGARHDHQKRIGAGAVAGLGWRQCGGRRRHGGG